MNFEVYVDGNKEFRWRLRAANNKIVADCGEGYRSKEHCLGELASIKKSASSAFVIDMTVPYAAVIPGA
jgi:uncharacterized protein